MRCLDFYIHFVKTISFYRLIALPFSNGMRERISLTLRNVPTQNLKLWWVDVGAEGGVFDLKNTA